MASFTVARAKHATLTASTVDTVTVTGVSAATGKVQVINRSASGTIHFTLDGTTPTVGGDDTYVVAAGQKFESLGPSGSAVGSYTVSVKLISTTADPYSVQAVA